MKQSPNIYNTCILIQACTHLHNLFENSKCHILSQSTPNPRSLLRIYLPCSYSQIPDLWIEIKKNCSSNSSETNAGFLRVLISISQVPWIVYKECWSQLVIVSLITSPEITIVWRSIPGKRGASCQAEGVPGSMSDVSAEWTILLNSGMLGASTLDTKVLLVLMVTSFPKRS